MKRLTEAKIKGLYNLYDSLEKYEKKASDLLKKAKRNSNGYLPVKREGKKERVQIKESDLWEEVSHLGSNCNAAEALKEKYPEVFKAFKKQNDLASQLRVYTMAELGIDYRQIKLSDIFQISEAMVEYHMPWNKFVRWLESLAIKIYELI